MKRQRQMPVRISDTIPVISGLVAARLLQPEVTPKLRHKIAFKQFARIAMKNFEHHALNPVLVTEMEQIYRSTHYWHGTGRYQWHDGKKIDVLQTILEAKQLTTHLDKFDPGTGKKVSPSISYAHSRLYARSYADMHHTEPDKLNRFLSAQYAAGFYVIRSYLRHAYLEAASHPSGFRAGRRELREQSLSREAQLPQSWTAKIRRQPVNPMFAFRAGSDIEDNYGILFGLDDSLRPKAVHPVFAETRESRSSENISLQHITHVEVPYDKVPEVSELMAAQGVTVPVYAIEDFEQYAAHQPIEQTLLG